MQFCGKNIGFHRRFQQSGKGVAEFSVSTVCIAETVIVGEVPDAYTNVEREGDDDSLTGDLIDFKAE